MKYGTNLATALGALMLCLSVVTAFAATPANAKGGPGTVVLQDYSSPMFGPYIPYERPHLRG